MSNFPEHLSLIGSSLKSAGKVMLLSRRHGISRCDSKGAPLVILGNGPSLKESIASHADSLRRLPSMAVNFAANAPEYESLRPDFYILADPHFFNSLDDVNVARLIESLSTKTSWPMRLFVPRQMKGKVSASITGNPNIRVETFNLVGAEGYQFLEHWLYNGGWAMPRPRNVLIPAIMVGILMGFKEIYLAGADHSWLKTLSVNDRNEVVSVQPHFYKEDEKEKARVATEYLNYPLHSILQSFYVAFKSYHAIRRFADSRNVKIYNSTPGSFIDAFDRRQLPAISPSS